MNRFGLVLILLVVGCASSPAKKPMEAAPANEATVTQVSKLGIWQVDQESCEKEAGKGAKICQSYVYSLRVLCQVDLLGTKKPLEGEPLAAYFEFKKVAEATSGKDGNVVLTFELPEVESTFRLTLKIRNDWLPVNPFTATELTLPKHHCERLERDIRAGREI